VQHGKEIVKALLKNYVLDAPVSRRYTYDVETWSAGRGFGLCPIAIDSRPIQVSRFLWAFMIFDAPHLSYLLAASTMR
jgi:hypothetical protein